MLRHPNHKQPGNELRTFLRSNRTSLIIYHLLSWARAKSTWCNWMHRWVGSLMRAPKLLRDGQLALTHLLSPPRSNPRTFYHLHTSPPPPPLRSALSANTISAPLRMNSNIQSSPEWTAKSVRDAFIQYFQKNGHTFGIPYTAYYILSPSTS